MLLWWTACYLVAHCHFHCHMHSFIVYTFSPSPRTAYAMIDMTTCQYTPTPTPTYKWPFCWYLVFLLIANCPSCYPTLLFIPFAAFAIYRCSHIYILFILNMAKVWAVYFVWFFLYERILNLNRAVLTVFNMCQHSSLGAWRLKKHAAINSFLYSPVNVI